MANNIETFNMKVRNYNDAVNRGDVAVYSEIGAEMLRMALDECSKTGIGEALKSQYRNQCDHIITRFMKDSKRAGVPARAGAGTEAVDPYYTEKDWFSDDVPELNFTDIIGVQEVKDAFMVDVIAPLHPDCREIYHTFRGDQLGTQILLYGPPGTGKTHIVKCLAGALGCKIAVVQTSEILASIVGVAEKHMRDVFAQASELDRCIIFIDEIDSLCSDRDSIDSRNTKSILTTMLTCMDGFVKTKSPEQLRIIVAATNLPWKLDAALKRGGRFEKQIYVPLPDYSARKKFVNIELEHIPHAENVTDEYLADKFDGFSGADIKAAMRQIANRPLRREIEHILRERKGAQGEVITLGDCEAVLSSYISVTTPEMMEQFDIYRRGL